MADIRQPTPPYYHIPGSSSLMFKALGHKNPQFVVDIMDISACTVRELKRIIAEKEGVSVEHQVILLAGKILPDCDTLGQYAVTKESKMDLVVRK